MTKFIRPIYDRTALDIANQTYKAFFNVTDWQRIYTNIRLLRELISALQKYDTPFAELAEPTTSTIPTAAFINTLIQNIENIRIWWGIPNYQGMVPLTTTWIPGIAGTSPTYLDVNAWEKVLSIVFNNVDENAEYQIYAGVATTGQPRLYQHRWRQLLWVPPSVTPVRRPRNNAFNCGVNMTRQNMFRRYN